MIASAFRRAWRRAGLVMGLMFFGLSAGASPDAANGEGGAPAAETTTPAVLFAGAPGRFEIVTISPALGPLARELADGVWNNLAGVLALPRGGFATSITVRLVPASLWQGEGDARVWVEAAGLVTLQIRVGEALDREQMVPALVRALLVKCAAVQRRSGPAVDVPLWLELGCARWVLVRMQPALHDQWRQDAEWLRPPPLLALLGWGRERTQPPGFEAAAYGALLWLQGLGEGNGEWAEFLRRQLTGQPALSSLGAYRGPDWTSIADVELDWDVALRELVVRSALPTLSIRESRALLLRWSRVVLHDTERKADVLLTSGELWSARREPVVRALAAGRTGEIELRLRSIHPFYLNAANSLGRYFLLLGQGGSGGEASEAWGYFETDWADAEELRALSAELLDRAQVEAQPAAR